MTPETALREAAQRLSDHLFELYDHHIDREYPWEADWKALHAALAAPTVTETDPIDALDAATPGPSWETTMDAELRAEALYSSTVTHGVHRHPMDGRSCREYVVGECAFAAPAVTETDAETYNNMAPQANAKTCGHGPDVTHPGCPVCHGLSAPADPTADPRAALREAAADLYRLARDGHGHDETHTADWPSCLPAHIAMARYRKAVAACDAAVPDATPAIDVERLARAMAIAADLARRAAPRRGWAKQAASIAHEYAALAPAAREDPRPAGPWTGDPADYDGDEGR